MLSDKEFISNDEIIKKAKLDSSEFGVSMGILKKNSCLLISKEGCKKTPGAKLFLEKLEGVKIFLRKSYPLEKEELSDDEKNVLDELKKRKNQNNS